MINFASLTLDICETSQGKAGIIDVRASGKCVSRYFESPLELQWSIGPAHCISVGLVDISCSL